MVDGSRPLFSAVSVHEGQEVYGSTPVSYQSLRKGVLEVFQEVGLPVQKIWAAFLEGWRCHFGSQLWGP